MAVIYNTDQLIQAGTSIGNAIKDYSYARSELYTQSEIDAIIQQIAPGYSPTSPGLGEVGSYAFLSSKTSNTHGEIVAGNTYSGSDFYFGGVYANTSNYEVYFTHRTTYGSPTGTWRAMFASDPTNSRVIIGLFLRIS